MRSLTCSDSASESSSSSSSSSVMVCSADDGAASDLGQVPGRTPLSESDTSLEDGVEMRSPAAASWMDSTGSSQVSGSASRDDDDDVGRSSMDRGFGVCLSFSSLADESSFAVLGRMGAGMTCSTCS
jgi:hypothetical protein